MPSVMMPSVMMPSVMMPSVMMPSVALSCQPLQLANLYFKAIFAAKKSKLDFQSYIQYKIRAIIVHDPFEASGP